MPEMLYIAGLLLSVVANAALVAFGYGKLHARQQAMVGTLTELSERIDSMRMLHASFAALETLMKVLESGVQDMRAFVSENIGTIEAARESIRELRSLSDRVSVLGSELKSTQRTLEAVDKRLTEWLESVSTASRDTERRVARVEALCKERHGHGS